MKQPMTSPAKQRQRKMLLVLPLLILPFITMAFWALGGGAGAGAQEGLGKANRGINTDLPSASLKEDANDKLAYYEKAAADSSRLRDILKNDPNVHSSDLVEGSFESVQDISIPGDNHAQGNTKYVDSNEAKVYQRLDQLNAVLRSGEQTPTTKGAFQRVTPRSEAVSSGIEERAKNLEHVQPATQDTELRQLNGMLEKILDIQHPERVQSRLQTNAEKNQRQFTVRQYAEQSVVGMLDTISAGDSTVEKMFLSTSVKKNQIDQNAIDAAVEGNQTLVNGSSIKMRLTDDAFIDRHLLHKGSFIYGTAHLSNERLVIEIASIRDDQSIYPVKLEVYDMDGMAGIYIPGAITRDVAKQSTDNALQSLALNSLDPSLGAQAASAGIETAKQLISKKVKLVKVWVKSGYRILLRDLNH